MKFLWIQVKPVKQWSCSQGWKFCNWKYYYLQIPGVGFLLIAYKWGTIEAYKPWFIE